MAGGELTGVLHLVDSLAVGGTETMATHLVNSLPRARFRPHLCTTRAGGPLAGRLCPDVGRLTLARKRAVDIGAIARLARYIRQQRIAILHAHATSLFIAVAAGRVCPGVHLVWHDHCGRHANQRRWRLLYRLPCRFVDGVIAASEALASWLRTDLHLPAHRVWYVPNFTPEPDKAACIELPGRAGFHIVHVANLRPEKDHFTLLRAMAALASPHPEAHLLLAGAFTDADYTAAVRAEIGRLGLHRHVTMLGPRTDVPAILAGCDIGVLSSTSEGLPLAAIEYGRAGLAVALTDAGQCAEVVDGGRAGLIVPPGDSGALARALMALIEDPGRRSALASALRSRVAERYGAEAAIRKVCEIYEQVLEG